MKKLKFIQALTIVVMAMVLVIGGCKKDDLSSIENKQNNNGNLSFKSDEFKIKVKDGRLVFADSSELQSFMGFINLNNENEDVIYNFYNTLGFVPMKKIYDDALISCDSNLLANYMSSYSSSFYLTTVDGEPYVDLPISVINSYIANADGVYQIGNKIVRETSDFKIIIDNGDESLMPLLFNFDNLTNNPHVTKSLPHGGTQYYPPSILNYSYKTNYFNNNNRLVVKMSWDENFDGGFSYLVHTVSQTKVGFVWFQKKISQLGDSNTAGSYQFTDNTTVYQIPANTIVQNDKASIWSEVKLFYIRYINFIPSTNLHNCWGTRNGITKSISNNEQFPNTW